MILQRHLVRMLALGLFVISLPGASAAPPPGYECVGGYEPTALSNVCYKSGTSPTPTGSVGTEPTRVCLIGTLCPTVPVPTYDPSGGTPVPVPTFEAYVEVLGIPIPGGLIGPCDEEGGDVCYYLLERELSNGVNEFCSGVEAQRDVEACQYVLNDGPIVCQALRVYGVLGASLCMYRADTTGDKFCIGSGWFDEDGVFHPEEPTQCF